VSFENEVRSQLERIGREVKEPLDDMNARLREVEQKHARRSGTSSSFGVNEESLGAKVAHEFEANRELFGKTRNIAFEVKSLTSVVTGRVGGIDVPVSPRANSTALVELLAAGDLDGMATLRYARRTGVSGGAGVQDAEGSAKPAAEPVFTAVSQAAITVAGYATVSEQALNTAATLRRAIDSHLTKSIRDASDLILIDGTAASQWPFAGFADLAATFTAATGYTSIVDAVLSGALRMRLQGFSPSVVVLNEAGYLGTQLAKDSTGRYLADNYAADLSLALGGMRVALSAGVPSGKALLLDPAFAGFLSSGSVRIQIGVINDQFVKNMVTIRGEIEILPYFTDYQGAMLVTPYVAP
jgi:HK97 family phage major capsid protein